jgi:antitoxin VapB
MTLNIENPRAEQLAHQLASEFGEDLTQAVIIALEERLERLRTQKPCPDIFQEIMNISKRCSSLPNQDSRSSEDILKYNQIGIPE